MLIDAPLLIRASSSIKVAAIERCGRILLQAGPVFSYPLTFNYRLLQSSYTDSSIQDPAFE